MKAIMSEDNETLSRHFVELGDAQVIWVARGKRCSDHSS